MAIARLASQDAQGTSTAATSVSATYAATPTANNLLISIIGDTDGNNNATAISGWSKVSPFGNVSTSNEVNIFYKVATGAESTTVTATTSVAVTANMTIYEYSGLATSSPFDVTANGGSQIAASSFSTGTTATTTVANELVLVAGFTTGVAVTFVSWSNSFNNRLNVGQTTFDLFTGDQIVASKAAYSSTLTYSANAACSTMIASFKGASTSVSKLSILGAG